MNDNDKVIHKKNDYLIRGPKDVGEIIYFLN